jgi:eukaryotic-like serine/threonine-protein kinase
MPPAAHTVESILAAAVEIGTEDQRRQFVERACAGDAELRRQVEELIENHFRAGSFLEAPAAHTLAATDEQPGERPGTVIGPYKLLEQLGEGGFGVVFLAEQARPVRRRVALKVLKPGMDSRQVVARFEAERQALALMDHPHIAKVLDGGTTASGRPYFVMELVRGLPLTEHCDQNSLPVRERLELFLPVCRAVQHAHQKGVIHRDLKPSNVLVTLHDGRAVPKVIDFGIAKALGQQLTEKTLFTGFAQMLGTPLYMSPEQAEMSGLDIDTRSDIYSLGVLLYELLTGTTPFDRDRLRRVGFDEIRRIIREEEPPRPSTRLSTVGQAATTASEKRRSDPRRLSRLFRGELDWIVMKALEKDRNRRYESASAFAADVQRYLNDEPVLACPPSISYRLRKFARRHKGPVLTGVAVLLALVGGMVGTTWGLYQANRSAAAERAANELTNKRLEQIEKGNEVLAGIFAELDIQQVKAGDLPLEAVLAERLVQAAGQFEGDSVGDPLAVAALQERLGLSLMNLGFPDRAIPVLQKSGQTRREALGPDHRDTLSSVGNLALSYMEAGKLDQALPLFEETFRLAKDRLGPDHRDTLASMSGLGQCYLLAGKLDRAVPLRTGSSRSSRCRPEGASAVVRCVAPDGPPSPKAQTGRKRPGRPRRQAGPSPPGTAPALGLRAGSGVAVSLSQTRPASENPPMRLTPWLRNRTSNHSSQGQAPRRPASPHSRPRLEALEDRCLPSFLAPAGYPVGPGPQAVVSADLNGDGKPDIVTANYTSQTISVLLGNGNGTFQAARNYAAGVGPGPSAVAVADLNGDGKPDVVTGGSLLPGNGDGTFKAAQNTNGGFGPVVVGDFNGDKKLDLATVEFGGDWDTTSVHVLLNNGKKSVGFYDGGSYSVPEYYGYPSSMTVGDLNHDGKADLLVTGDAGDGYGYVSVLLDNGKGNYPLFQAAQSYYFGAYPSSAAVGDVNGDGKPDVVTANSDGTARVWQGNGDGTLGAARGWAVGPSPSAVALADVNGDGKPDVVTANSGNNTVSVLPGDGDGTFGLAQTYAAGTSYLTSAVAVGDFNGDHKPDLAVTDDSTYWGYYNSGGTSSVSVRLNAGDWSTTHFVVSGFPASTTAGAAGSFTVTVKNANGTTDTGYTGTVHFVSTDAQAGLPADYTFTAADQGTHTFSAALKTAGTQNLWATDTHLKATAGGETGIAVQPGAASTFRFRPGYEEVPYGTTVSFTVTAYDAYGNVATGYNGTVHFTSTDPLAVLPADAALSNGSGRFSATVNTAGTQWITATDTASPGVTGAWDIAVMPVVEVSGPSIGPYSGLVNQPLTFTLLASGAAAGADYTFYISRNDGSALQSVTGPSGTTVTLTFGGTTTLSVWAYYEGVPSTIVNYGVDILDATATVQADPADSTRQMLVLDATRLPQNVSAGLNIGLGAGANNGVTVTINGSAVGNFTAGDGSPFALVEVFGSANCGTTIDARGLSVSTVLVGGDNNDILYGGSGRNLLIGGAGSDTLYAGSGGDILIGGHTSYDNDLAALAAVMAEWGRTDVDYATRVAHLSGSLGGLNGSYLLNATTVFDDGTTDVLYGGTGLDWFIAHRSGQNQDQVIGQTSGEVVTSI